MDIVIYDSDTDEELINRGDCRVVIDHKFKVIQPETWPTADNLSFNESQYEAYRLALTHEFAVIQGPPGTGKTFVGIKVAKVLLQNLRSEGNCLMLIICYTNHALDQFLEAISQITQSIVRIGGQSRNKAMDQFNLSNLRRQSLAPGLRSTYSFFIDQKNQLRNSIQDLQLALKTFDILNNGVLRYEFLCDDGGVRIPDLKHLDAYYKKMGIHVDPLKYWLFDDLLDDYPEYTRDFNDCLLEYSVLVNNEEDVDEKRTEMILDDEKVPHDQRKLDDLVMDKANFLLSRAKAEIKKLVMHFVESDNFNEKYRLQQDIQELDFQINLFNVSFTRFC